MIAVIAILVAILLPAVQRVRANARSSQSKNNLSQMGKAMKHYEGLGRGNLRQTGWQQTLRKYADKVDEMFVDPADTNGAPSYALSNKVASFARGDSGKIAIIESDDLMIKIENADCGIDGVPDIENEPVARHLGMVNALLYGGSVRSFELAEIDLTDSTNEPLVLWWLPYSENGNVCGTVVTIDNPNELPTPTGSDPDVTLIPENTPQSTEGECGTCDPSTSLVAHYPLDDPDPAEDITGNGNHGQTFGDPVFHSDRGGCMFFDGTDDYINVPDEVLEDDAGTVSLWMRATGFSGDPDVRLAFGNYYNGSVNRFYIGQDDASITGQPPGNCFVAFDANKHLSRYQLQLDQWHHLVMVWCDGRGKSYIDGQLFFEDDVDYTNISYKVSIASIGQGSHGYWMGYIDDIRVYNCALAPSQFPQ
ncbi:MAG: LamG domain-containing protein [Pirellulales bacterium]|nr:LamG domain-containing protein [Pirellulales bacterium]